MGLCRQLVHMYREQTRIKYTNLSISVHTLVKANWRLSADQETAFKEFLLRREQELKMGTSIEKE